jgi:hypothetical protein
MLAHPSTDLDSWSRERRASCGERMRDPSGPRTRVSASSAALRFTRRGDAQARRSNGGGRWAPEAPSRGALESVSHHAGFLPEVRECITRHTAYNKHDTFSGEASQ